MNQGGLSDDDCLAVIAVTREMHNAGWSPRQIANWLNDANVPTSSGRGFWWPTTAESAGRFLYCGGSYIRNRFLTESEPERRAKAMPR